MAFTGFSAQPRSQLSRVLWLFCGFIDFLRFYDFSRIYWLFVDLLARCGGGFTGTVQWWFYQGFAMVLPGLSPWHPPAHEISDWIIHRPMGQNKIRFVITFPRSLVCLCGTRVFKRVAKTVPHGFEKRDENPTLWRCFPEVFCKVMDFTVPGCVRVCKTLQ